MNESISYSILNDMFFSAYGIKYVPFYERTFDGKLEVGVELEVESEDDLAFFFLRLDQ